MSSEQADMSITWEWLGLAPSVFDEKAEWLAEARRLGSGCDHFFFLAGKLLQLAKKDHLLISPAFFHTVIGLERALKVHYKRKDEAYGWPCEGSSDPFAELFQRAVDEGLISDVVISDIRPLPEWTLKLLDEEPESHVGKLAKVVPKLRNLYFHGTPLMTGEFFFVALQLREIADALKTSPVRTLLD